MIKEMEENQLREEKYEIREKADFSQTLASDFLIFKVWNPPLFIGGGRWTLCFFRTNPGP